MSHSFAPTPGSPALRWVEIPGHGAPVLYLHGLGSASLDTWAQTWPRLGRPAIVLDLLGHGLSDRPGDFSYSLREHADVIAAAIRTFERKVDVVAHSLGGSVAVLLAEHYPDLVRRNVLVEPGLDARPRTPDSLAALDESTLSDEAWAQVLARESPERLATMRLADPIALVRSAVAIDAAQGGDLTRIVSNTTVPTLIVVGQRVYEQQDLLDGSPIEFARIPGARHFVMNDQSDLFAQRVLEFWEAHPRPAHS